FRLPPEGNRFAIGRPDRHYAIGGVREHLHIITIDADVVEVERFVFLAHKYNLLAVRRKRGCSLEFKLVRLSQASLPAAIRVNQDDARYRVRLVGQIAQLECNRSFHGRLSTRASRSERQRGHTQGKGQQRVAEHFLVRHITGSPNQRTSDREVAQAVYQK